MTHSIAWYQSKTVWASLIAAAAGLGGAFGLDIGDDLQSDLSEAALQIVAVVASISAIYGRVIAKNRIE